MIKNALHEFLQKEYDLNTVIGEFSGRDSVAAIIKAFEREDINFILPIATFAGTEYGDYDVIYENYKKLKEMIETEYGNRKILYPLFEYNREDIWAIMNGRYITELVNKFKFYNPCIGCHLYFHLTKIPFANKLSKRIISGERESHDGRVKVNQTHTSLEFYKKVLNELGFELIMPIQYIEDGHEIENLVKWDWAEGKEHPKCVLSGNYRDSSGKAKYDENRLNSFLSEYLHHAGSLVGKNLLGDLEFDEVKKEIGKLI